LPIFDGEGMGNGESALVDLSGGSRAVGANYRKRIRIRERERLQVTEHGEAASTEKQVPNGEATSSLLQIDSASHRRPILRHFGPYFLRILAICIVNPDRNGIKMDSPNARSAIRNRLLVEA